jgi:hypothetical protein
MSIQTEELFLKSWNIGIHQYLEDNKTDILRNSFITLTELASKSRTPNTEGILLTIRAHKYLYNDVLINKPPNTEEKLKELGIDLTNVLSLIYKYT